ncbi:MAG TPA: hypothetical protein VG425_08200 [Casimicrobiaceae bacterium]|nr:hypothetical protein [Casimicrobiaceae bacterium]
MRKLFCCESDPFAGKNATPGHDEQLQGTMRYRCVVGFVGIGTLADHVQLELGIARMVVPLVDRNLMCALRGEDCYRRHLSQSQPDRFTRARRS